jgi:hypothetical protein
MNRGSINQHCKVILRKIKTDWGSFSEEDIASMQKQIEIEEWMLQAEGKIRKKIKMKER